MCYMIASKRRNYIILDYRGINRWIICIVKKPMIISYSGYENITSKIHSGYISEAEDIDGLCNNLIKIY